MDLQALVAVAGQEFTVNVRNKWMMVFSVVFAVLVTAIAYVGTRAEGFGGIQSFTRTSASIVNMVLYIVPLVALTMGTLSFTGDKGSLELLFAQPVLRSTIQLGKILGLFFSLTVSTLTGFCVSGIMILVQNGADGFGSYIAIVLLSITLGLVFIGISAAVATACRRKPKAFGYALFLWFFFVLLYDLLAVGISLLLRGQTVTVFLFLSLFGNPVDMVRVASLILLDNVTIFGTAGAALLRFLGGESGSIILLLTSLVLWFIFPLVISHRMLNRQDI